MIFEIFECKCDIKWFEKGVNIFAIYWRYDYIVAEKEQQYFTRHLTPILIFDRGSENVKFVRLIYSSYFNNEIGPYGNFKQI